jgi:hypothetical protein
MSKHFFTTEKILLLSWVLVNLLIGILIVQDFGISFDEPRYYQYAAQSVDAFKSWFARLHEPNYGPANLRFYGPSYILLIELILRGMHFFWSHVPTIDVWHFSYFILFQLTGLCLYLLSKRWLNLWSAWFVMVIFTTQPLLWGHAFINPKDIPFMAFVTLSIYFGFRMVDSLGGHTPQISIQNPWQQFAKAWSQIPTTARKKVIDLLTIGVVVLLLTKLFDYLVARMIIFFFSADVLSVPGKIFGYFANRSSNTPLNDYISYAQTIFHRFEFSILGLGLIGTISWCLYLLSKTETYHDTEVRWNESVKSLPAKLKEIIGKLFSKSNWRNAMIQFLRTICSGKVILAGIVLGLTISIRILGPLPGLMVLLYLILKNRQKTPLVIPTYLFWAFLTTYITWPYLWSSPISRYLESVMLMINFPWPGRVLFNNNLYRPEKLPFEYLPVLMNIQFTEPVLILFYIGFFASLRKLVSDKIPADSLFFIALGFAIPLAGSIFLHISLYDNFRQLLFLVPPAFVIAGYGFKVITNKLKSRSILVTLIVICASPGIYSIVQLHPYQYIYYNSLVGGVNGAERRFELDYWRTSYREIALQVNERASLEANIFVSGAPFSYLPYSRSDLTIENKIDPNRFYDFEYAVLTSRWNSDEYLFPDAEIVYTVERDEAILSVLKYVKRD